MKFIKSEQKNSNVAINESVNLGINFISGRNELKFLSVSESGACLDSGINSNIFLVDFSFNGISLSLGELDLVNSILEGGEEVELLQHIWSFTN